jgi:protein O-mannosyl-transferase
MINSNSSKETHQNFLIRYPYLFIAFFAFIVYGQTIFFDYSYNDDDIMILHNTKLQNEYGNIKMAFKTDAWFREKQIELYRPLQSLSYMLDYSIAGSKPFIYHLTNLLLHILNCCLLFYLLRLMNYSPPISMTGASIQAVHFAFLHTVCWIPGRGDLLLAFFAIISLATLIKIDETKNKAIVLIHFIASFLALLAKETAILLPVLFILYRILISKKRIFEKTNILLAVGYILIYIPYLILRKNAISPLSTSLGLKPLIRNLPILPETLIKFFLPINFSVMPEFKLISTISGIAALILLGYMIFTLKNYNKSRILWGGLLFLILSIPAMFYRPDFSDYGYDYLDHRIYFPGIGLTIIMLDLMLCYRVFEKHRFKFFLAVFFISTSFTTIVLSRNYSDPLKYYTQAVKSNKHSALAFVNRGNILMDKGNTDKALADYSMAIKLKPDFSLAYRNRGQLYETLNINEKALEDLKQVDKINPRQTEILLRIGNIENKLQKYQDAIKYFNEVIEIDNNNAAAYLSRGNSYKLIRDYNAALNDYSRSIKMNPDMLEAFLARGVLYGGLGRFQESVKDINIFLSSNPNHGYAHYFRGMAYLELKNTNDACADLELALNLGISKASQYIQKYCKQ